MEKPTTAWLLFAHGGHLCPMSVISLPRRNAKYSFRKQQPCTYIYFSNHVQLQKNFNESSLNLKFYRSYVSSFSKNDILEEFGSTEQVSKGWLKFSYEIVIGALISGRLPILPVGSPTLFELAYKFYIFL